LIARKKRRTGAARPSTAGGGLTPVKGAASAAAILPRIPNRHHGGLMYEHILVPIDGSATSTRGLDEAIRLAKLTGGTIRLLHVLDELIFVTGFETGATYVNDVLPMLKEGGQRILAEGKARVDAAGVPVETLLAECFATRTSEVVLTQAEAWKADLIVLGTHGRRGVGRMLLGSDAEQIVRTARVPVLLVRAEEVAGAAAASQPAGSAAA
jgi:nucleotide-binding universal stress UspA family protein